MKTLFLLKPHSIIDVITNSSSEIFVCDGKHSIEFVTEFLKQAVELHALSEGREIKFEDVFGEIYMLTEENVDEFIEDYVIGWELTHYSWDDIQCVPSYWNIQRKNGYSDWETTRKEHDRLVAEWRTENYDKVRKAALGMVVVHDSDENAIPYEMFSLIERTLDAERRHLG